MLLFILISVLLVWLHAETPVMRLASPWFLLSTLAGLALLISSVFAWLGPASVVTCTIRIWLAFVGFVTALSGIIAKTYRVFVIFKRRKKIRKIIVTNGVLIKYMAFMIFPMVVFLLIWSALDKPQPVEVLVPSGDHYVMICHSNSQAWLT